MVAYKGDLIILIEGKSRLELEQRGTDYMPIIKA